MNTRRAIQVDPRPRDRDQSAKVQTRPEAFDPERLRASPFLLDDLALEWVCDVFAGLTTAGKIGQMVVPLLLDSSPENLGRLLDLQIGGLLRFPFLPAARLQKEAKYLQKRSVVPLLMCADCECLEGYAIGGNTGTAYPNQMAVGATNDPTHAVRMARLVAREGASVGINWSLTPVSDLSLEPRSGVVNTRSFGDDPEHVASFCEKYISALQAEGVAACAKHFPGDGTDDRNQHFVTSVNRLQKADWNDTYGHVLRTVIDAGVLSVMSAHIAFPAQDGADGRPASLSSELNLNLLRGELHFNGVIVSDATVMGGITSQGPRAEIIPRLVEHGCDILLCTEDLELDLRYLHAGLDDGRLSQQRLDEAVWRVLGLKAALGLHHSARKSGPASRSGRARQEEHARWAEACAEHAVTLVKDEPRLLPLSIERHRRVLLVEETGRRNFLGPLQPLQLERLLRDRGYNVERFNADTTVTRDYYDVLIYAVAKEGSFLETGIELDWIDLHGELFRSMERYWHILPCVFVSLGSPYHVREVPQCPTFINAYSPILPMQEAVVRALTGEIPFRGVSPVSLAAAIAIEGAGD